MGAVDESALHGVRRIPDGSWVSADGRWLWRDVHWIPLPATRETGGVFWFISAPGWVQTILILGLIGLIPFVGAMNIYGYAIVTARNIRAGYRVLPPANFAYIGLGAPVFVLGLAWATIMFFVTLAVTGAVAYAAYGQTHSPAWPIALGIATALTVLGVANIPALPLLAPALEMSDREGWGIFRIQRLVRHATKHWRSAWYGGAIFLLWYLIYFALTLVLSVIPFGSILAAVAASPVLAPMIAVAVTRFYEPPAGFTKSAANALAAGWLALWILGLAVPWGIGVAAASFVSSHPDETACFFQSGCSISNTGNLEAIAQVHRDARDPTLVRVDVKYINRSPSHADVFPTDYYARTSAGVDLPPSNDCPVPEAATLSPGERLTQHVCFRLPSTGFSFQVHLPWIGWSYRTY